MLRLPNHIRDTNMTLFYFAKGMRFRALFVVLFSLFLSSTIVYSQEYDEELLKIIDGERELSFRIELADTPARRATGLMHRQTMPVDAGMLFCFDTTKPVFMWMKNTILPLDMIFVREDGTIATIAKNTVPYSEEVISSGEPVLFVLELNAGASSKFNIKNENRLVHSSISSCALRGNGVDASSSSKLAE